MEVQATIKISNKFWNSTKLSKREKLRLLKEDLNIQLDNNVKSIKIKE